MEEIYGGGIMGIITEANEDGVFPEFSVSFVATQSKRKGQILTIKRAVLNATSKERAKERVSDKAASKVRRKKTIPKKTGNINVRVLDSNDFKVGETVTIKRCSIVFINGFRIHFKSWAK